MLTLMWHQLHVKHQALALKYYFTANKLAVLTIYLQVAVESLLTTAADEFFTNTPF